MNKHNNDQEQKHEAGRDAGMEHMPPDLLQGQVSNAKKAEEDLTPEEPVEQHRESRRKRIKK